jgi:hypothetical protein
VDPDLGAHCSKSGLPFFRTKNFKLQLAVNLKIFIDLHIFSGKDVRKGTKNEKMLR